MTQTSQPDAAPTPAPADPRIARAAVDLRGFGLIAAQLAVLLLVIWQLNVDHVGFLRVTLIATAGFVLHYFCPFAIKKLAFLAISLIGGTLVLSMAEGQLTILSFAGAAICVAITFLLGLAFFVTLKLPLPFWVRVGVLVLIGLALAMGRTALVLPDVYWKVIGAIFMFRLIIYAYEVKIGRAPERLIDFLCYFYLLPNFYFFLFPVIDYSTFKRSYYQDDIHKTAQRGVDWMVRGVVHLCLYRLIYHTLPIRPDEVQSLPTLVRFVFPTFLLYLQVSGQFHFIVGMLHLFGFKLPETNRKYLLAESFTDFWRRINIYWKDFMVKIFYYPAYFRLRKKNETAALVVATIFVFIVTTVLHGYQLFWLQGEFIVTWGDGLFWTALGVLVLVNVLIETKRKPVKRSPRATLTRRIFGTIGVYLTITILWSMWSATSLAGWFETVSYWR